MKVPRANEKSKELFRSVLPDDPRIIVRPMFGNISGFVNGNMFAGLFGDDLFVRLSEEKHNDLLRNKGARLLEPVAGKPMKDYVVIPRAWLKQADTVRKWIALSLDFTSSLPPKKKGK